MNTDLLQPPRFKNLGVVVHCPRAISTKKSDAVNALPPSSPVSAFDVDRYDLVPDSWMRGSKKASSYFLPVKANTGLWLDFNHCWEHEHDVAIAISIQGVNPVDGKSVLQELSLNQYPADKEDPDAPPQNYLATTSTPHGLLWLDGFRSADGEVRQWVFTAEQMRGIAAQVLGSERVFAIGIAFYLSKTKHKKRPDTYNNNYTVYESWLAQATVKSAQVTHWIPLEADLLYRDNTIWGSSTLNATGVVRGSSAYSCRTGASASATAEPPRYSGQVRCTVEPEYIARSEPEPDVFERLEVAAGARINQRIHRDTEALDYWDADPAGIIYINYCDERLCKEITGSQMKGSARDGFLKNLKIGA